MLRPGTMALTVLLAALTALGPLSIDMYLPSLPDIAQVLAAPQAHVQLTVSSYLIGFAVGQIIYGPLSDRHGRRPVLLAALALYVTGTGICAATQSIDPLIGARFLQGIGGAGSIVLARAIVRDLYSGVRAARELSLMGSISAFSPIAAPMIGGVLQIAFGWRASFVVMGFAAVAAFLMASRLLPETLRLRVAEPFSLPFLIKGFGLVLRHRGFLAYLGIITTSYAGLFAWISGAAVVLEGLYGFSPVTFGFTFALGAAGYMVGAASAARLVVRLGLDRMMGLGVTAIAAGGLGLALAVATHIDGVWLILAMAVYLAGLGLGMPQAMAGALTPFPDRAGTAASLMGVVQQVVAAAAAAVVGNYLGSSAWPLAGVVVTMGCLTFLIWALTRRVRAQERPGADIGPV
jgi:MFS transporter, DHA1 family, multidrug resistance protein